MRAGSSSRTLGSPVCVAEAGGIDFTAERARHSRFVGRSALLAQLDQLLIGVAADRWVVVTGGPSVARMS